MNWWEIVSALLGLSCVILAGRNSKYNFWIGYLYNIFLFVLFWRNDLFAAMALQPVAFAINIYGHWRWTHPSQQEQSASDSRKLKVSSVAAGEWLVLVLVVLVSGSAVGVLLDRYTPDPSPWLDSYIMMFTFLAQWLSARKRWECWIVWMLLNMANMVLYLSSGLWIMCGVAFLYLVNGICSVVHWRRLLKNGN